MHLTPPYRLTLIHIRGPPPPIIHKMWIICRIFLTPPLLHKNSIVEGQCETGFQKENYSVSDEEDYEGDDASNKKSWFHSYKRVQCRL